MNNEEFIIKVKDLCDKFGMPCPDSPTSEDIFKIVNSLFELRQMRNTKNTLQVVLSTELYNAIPKNAINKSTQRAFDRKIDFLSGGGFEADYINYLQQQGREIIFKLGQVGTIVGHDFFEGEPDAEDMLSLQMLIQDMSVLAPTLASPEARQAMDNAVEQLKKHL